MPRDPVTIIQTGVANTASVAAAFGRLNMDVALTDRPDDVRSASQLVLPGVGAFGAGMDRLRQAALVEPLAERIDRGRPTLAICLGLQLLCARSQETPGDSGIGAINSTATRFPSTARVPQFGWNRVEPIDPCDLIEPGFAYFANSYRLEEIPTGWSGAMSEHGGPFVAAIQRGAVLACQFHPELSGAWGLALIQRWSVRTREESISC